MVDIKIIPIFALQNLFVNLYLRNSFHESLFISHSKMTAFNIFLILLAIVAGALGFRSGIIKQIGSLVGIVAGIIGCRIYGEAVAQWGISISSEETSPVLVTILAYVAVFILAYLALTLAASLLRNIVKAIHISFIDRIAGSAFRIVLWFFVLSIALNVWVAFLPEQAPQGIWAQRVEKIAPIVMGTEPVSALMKE